MLRHRAATCFLLALGISSCSDSRSVIAPENARTAALFQVTEGQSRIADVATRGGQYRRIWPHQDGQGWTYHITGRTWDQPAPVLYPTRGEVPVFTIADAIRLLETEPTGANPETSSGSYRLQFSGSVTTLSGVTRQNLRATLEQGTTATVPSFSPVAGNAAPQFLDLLRRARPDLAKKADQNVPSMATRAVAAQAAANVFFPTLIHGYAWEQTDQWVGTYGDLNQQIAWIFLMPDLRPGSEFSLQLVPELAPDVFLHARVLGWKRVETEAGVFHRALDVAYLVDFGVGEITDVDGNTLGYHRSVLFGTVDYGVGVGPVRSYERLRFAVDPLNRGNSDQTASLIGTLATP